ncbi:hypothetical protein LT20_01584 [Pseudomonas aeruginosa]|nr:hypothetical protein LT20_01584 [Pseudomonas aeruginosa]
MIPHSPYGQSPESFWSLRISVNVTERFANT